MVNGFRDRPVRPLRHLSRFSLAASLRSGAENVICRTAITTLIRQVAEREGFEPSVELPLHTLSRRAPSATRTSLLDSVRCQATCHRFPRGLALGIARDEAPRRNVFKSVLAIRWRAHPIAMTHRQPMVQARVFDEIARAIHRTPLSDPLAPNTNRLDSRLFTSAPAHMAQGSRVTYIVQFSRRRQSSTEAFCGGPESRSISA